MYRRLGSMGEFRTTQGRNKNGEVTVITRKKSGFRSLNVTGKIDIPSILFDDKIVNHTILNCGRQFPGFFPFLRQDRNSSILTYSFPEKYQNPKKVSSKQNIQLFYDFHYVISNDISTQSAIDEVLDRNGWIKEDILKGMEEKEYVGY